MIFLDTNVVIAYLSASHEHHASSLAFIKRELSKQERLVISPQVVGETFVTMTSKRKFEYPISATEFKTTIAKFMSFKRLLVVSPGTAAIEFALDAAEKSFVASARIFDLLIYGTMREHGITCLATFNEKDFRNLSGLILAKIPR